MKDIINEKLKVYIHNHIEMPSEFFVLLKEFLKRKQIIDGISDQDYAVKIDKFLNAISNGISYKKISSKVINGGFSTNKRCIHLKDSYKEKIKDCDFGSFISGFFHECMHAYDCNYDKSGNIIFSGVCHDDNGKLDKRYTALNEMINQLKTEFVIGNNYGSLIKNQKIVLSGYCNLQTPLDMIIYASGMSYSEFMDPNNFNNFSNSSLNYALNTLNNSYRNLFKDDFKNELVIAESTKNISNSYEYIYKNCLNMLYDRIENSLNENKNYTMDDLFNNAGSIHYDYQMMKKIYANCINKLHLAKNKKNIDINSTEVNLMYDRLINAISSKDVYCLLQNPKSNIQKFKQVQAYISLLASDADVSNLNIERKNQCVLDNQTLNDQSIKKYERTRFSKDQSLCFDFDNYSLMNKLIDTIQIKDDTNEKKGENKIFSIFHNYQNMDEDKENER